MPETRRGTGGANDLSFFYIVLGIVFITTGILLVGSDISERKSGKAKQILREEKCDQRRICPSCNSTDVRRSHRVTLFEKVLSVLSLWPFRCMACNHRFWKKNGNQTITG
jgi:hypothetical protein